MTAGLLSAPLWALPAKPDGYVTDQANALDAATKQKIESLLSRFEDASSIQIAVVTVPSLEGSDVESAAVTLFKNWGIGQKGKDNGVLFLIAPNDRRMRIEVGYGLEGDLPDGLAGRILDEAVVPRFKANDMAGGIWTGTAMICQVLAQKRNIDLNGFKEMRDAPVPHRKATFFEKIFFLLFLFFFIFVFIKNPWLALFLLSRGGRGGGGGFGGGGFGGFGGGMSGGGGASRGW